MTEYDAMCDLCDAPRPVQFIRTGRSRDGKPWHLLLCATCEVRMSASQAPGHSRDFAPYSGMAGDELRRLLDEDP